MSIPVTTMARYVRIQIPATEFLTLAEVEALGPAWQRNFAAEGTATQSSTAYSAPPERANDQNSAGSYYAKSVTHTAADVNAWWQVDFGVVRTLNEIRVWNRTDCCSQRLSDFYVFASAVPFASNDPSVLARDPNVTSARVSAVPEPMVSVPIAADARYVRVQNVGSGFLSLAEVEALGPVPRDYVLGGAASQSSTYREAIAERAQDGVRNGVFDEGGVTHTNKELRPWWQVDFGASYRLNQIRVWNRSDCCRDRLSNFYVFTSDKPFASTDPTVLAQDPTVTTNRITTIPDPSVSIPVDTTARYLLSLIHI